MVMNPIPRPAPTYRSSNSSSPWSPARVSRSQPSSSGRATTVAQRCNRGAVVEVIGAFVVAGQPDRDPDVLAEVLDELPQPASAARVSRTTAVCGCDFSPEGRLLASSGQDNDGVRIWQTTTGRELVTMRGHGASVEQVRFTPDGRPATAHGDSTIRIWQCEVCGPITEVRTKAGALLTRDLTAEERDAFVLPNL
jgi:hypothetical protein